MGLAHLEIFLNNQACEILQDCWRTDLVIQYCGKDGAYLVNVWPELIPQLQGRYPSWTITSHWYQGAQRIMLMPPSTETITHIDVDVPPGCYKIWTRVCHGANEETSVAKVAACCEKPEHCVNLILPQMKTCAAGVMHPLMDHLVYNQRLANDAERLIAFQGLLHGAELKRDEVIAQLDYRYQEAVAKGDTALQDRVQAVRNLANQLPVCLLY